MTRDYLRRRRSASTSAPLLRAAELRLYTGPDLPMPTGHVASTDDSVTMSMLSVGLKSCASAADFGAGILVCNDLCAKC